MALNKFSTLSSQIKNNSKSSRKGMFYFLKVMFYCINIIGLNISNTKSTNKKNQSEVFFND